MTDRSARTLLDKFLIPDLVNVVFSYVEEPIKRVSINRREVAYFRLSLDIERIGVFHSFDHTFEYGPSTIRSTEKLRSGSDWYFQEDTINPTLAGIALDHVHKRTTQAYYRRGPTPKLV